MNVKRRPPSDMTPEQFFTAWLPAEVERLGSASGLPEARVRFELSGEGGGAWELCFRGGELGVVPSAASEHPLVTLQLTVEDWRAIMIGEEGPICLTPPTVSPLDLLFIDAISRRLVTSICGTFCFQVQQYNGRTWELVAAFGARPLADQADAVISTDAETYAAILARRFTAHEAYSQGKIRVTGDVNRGLQVGLALLPKF
jgi:hypothetical protein